MVIKIMKNLRKQVRAEINSLNVGCNATGREAIASNIIVARRDVRLQNWSRVLKYAEEVGGCKPGEEYSYPNAQGQTSIARVCDLYNLPTDMVNPYLVCFSGMMTAHLFAMEAIRFYAKKTNLLLPLLAIGKEGNKGLFSSVFNRKEGIVIGTEYETYLNAFEKMAPSSYVRRNQKAFEDMDTLGNLIAGYDFAKEEELDEITLVLCSGNFSYDKRLLSEWMLELKNKEYSDVKINIVLIHCPIFTGGNVPEGHISDILLGYVAASLGPLKKDTVPFGSDEKGERYLMPGVEEADWSVFEDLITNYSNMGWPDYQILLYGIDKDTAVENIIISDLYARASFSPEAYDEGVLQDIINYTGTIVRYFGDDNEINFLEYLKRTPDVKYFG